MQRPAQNFLASVLTKTPGLTAAVLGLLAASPAIAAPEHPVADNRLAASSAVAAPERPVADNGLAAPASRSVQASEIESDSSETGMDQVTSVSQLADVNPRDWAFQALQSLVERYGCIAGYPDKTFRGNQALTRYEFAAGLNACLDRVNELIAAGTADLVRKEDLIAIQRLQEEYAAELVTLRGRTDTLESRTATLEKQQFSTTTKLFGQAIIGVQGHNSPDISLAGIRFNNDSDQVNVISSVQLSLYTQFSERSLLLTGLQAGSGNTFGNQLLTRDTLLGYEGDTGSSIQLSDLTYRQLVGNNLALVVGARGVNMVNVFRGANRIESAGQGPLSRFAQRNPIHNIGGDGAGAGFDWQISPNLSLQAVYTANRPNDPVRGGLFGSVDGSNTAGVQLAIAPTPTIDIAFNYVNSYSPFGALGTAVGDDQLALSSRPDLRAPIQTNAFGATVGWRVTPKLTLGGWAGYTNSELKGASGRVETLNWMAFLNFPDLFAPGNLGAIYVGQPPRITNSDLPSGSNVPSFISQGDLLAGPGDQPGRTTHVEGFYRFRVSDNISITPGFVLIFNPNHNPDNDTIAVGVLRTTFTF
ncbi:MAG TPA: iron uptake porin [Thermosynechococcaceae cyanobacterium]